MIRSNLEFANRYGPWASVAGASEGMGHQYALQLADRGLSIVMLARREERLLDAAREVRAKGVEVRTASLDLASENLKEELAKTIDGLEIGLLVGVVA